MEVGKSVRRVDAFDKATGRAKYCDDLCALIACGDLCVVCAFPRYGFLLGFGF